MHSSGYDYPGQTRLDRLYSFELSYRDGVFTDEEGDSVGGWCTEFYKNSESTGIVFLSDNKKDCVLLTQDFYSLFMKNPDPDIDFGSIDTLKYLITQSGAASVAVMSLITDTNTHRVLAKTISQLLESRCMSLMALKIMLDDRKKTPVKAQVVKRLVDIAENNLQCATEALKEIVGELERVD